MSVEAFEGTGFSLQRSQPAPGVTLHRNLSNKRKTNTLNVYWVGNLSEQDVTARSLLPSVLQRGTRSFPSTQALTQQLEYLYGSTFSSYAHKIGERHVLGFRSEFVNDHFLPAGAGITSSLLDFAREFIHEPHLEDGKFPADVLDQEKLNHRRLIESLINDKRSYAFQRCIQEMCADEVYRTYDYGRVEDVDAIDSAALLEIHESCRRGAETHVYVSGDLTEAEALAMIEPLVGTRDSEPEALRELTAPRTVGTVREHEEEMDIQQANLVLGYRTGMRFDDPQVEAGVLANGLFGLFPHSLLFRNVREKESLCYSIGSQLERSYGLLFVSAGVANDQAERARELIGKELKDLQSGNFSDEEITATKAAFDQRLLMLEDSPESMASIDLTWRLSGVEYNHDGYRQRLRAVTRDEIVAAAQRFDLDTVFLLRGNS